MLQNLLLGAALMLGQTDPGIPRAQLAPPSGSEIFIETIPAPIARPATSSAASQVVAGSTSVAGSCDAACCGNGFSFRGLFHRERCDTGCGDRGCCNIQCLKPWTCDDLKMDCEEPKCHAGCQGGFLHRLLFCPEEPEEEEAANGEKKNGNGKNGKDEKKNGEAPAEEEEESDDHAVLMQVLRCYTPGLFERMQCNGTKLYGFIQGGFTANFDSPDDRLNYGVNFNNRSNDVLLNQVYLILEKPLDLDKKKDVWHLGYRVDFMYGHDSPYFENAGLGLWPNYLGDRLEASRLTEMGIGLWQFYADLHAPVLTERGVDFRVGRFISLMGYESTPGNLTDFYSRRYEFFYGVPFTNTGALATVHVGDTVDITNGIVRGYEVVFQDNNDSWSYTGAVAWNDCDGNGHFHIAWITGPEQNQNNHNDRTLFTIHGSRKFGPCKEWRILGGGSVGWEQKAATALATGLPASGEWYGSHVCMFYTVNPKLVFALRGEWWRDDDGVRTAFANSDNGGALWNRPGYAGDFYEVTFGATYKPWQNFRIRPEIRADWFNGIAVDGSNSRPFNDQRDDFQITFGIDAIWEF
jgi:hypothetical protein